MNKQLIVLVVASLAMLQSKNVWAQLIPKPGLIVGGNLMYAKPSSDFSNTHSYGIGAEAYGGLGWGKTFVTATAGIGSFKSSTPEAGNITYTPLKVGVRRFLLGKLIFANTDIGIAFLKDKQTGANKTRFTRGVGAGVRFMGLEGSLYYDGWKSINQSGYSNSLNFKLGMSFAL